MIVIGGKPRAEGLYAMASDLSSAERYRCWNYRGEESEKGNHDVKGSHDEEVKDAIVENRSHQPGHGKLVVVSSEPEDEDNNASECNQICAQCEVPGCLRNGERYIPANATCAL